MAENYTLGKTGLSISPIGYGAFKIGRNQQIKYRDEYELPTAEETSRLIQSMLDLGINYIDTAPAYGMSEERIGAAIAHRRKDVVLSTKVGEIFDHNGSRYDYSFAATIKSIHNSLKHLKTDVLDIVFVHSNGRDLFIQQQTEVVDALQQLKSLGFIRAIGFSGKTVDGARLALNWADVLMVEYHLDDPSHAEVMAQAHRQNLGVVVKKGLASGYLPASEAIRFVLGNANVDSLVIGGLNLQHIKQNYEIAREIVTNSTAA